MLITHYIENENITIILEKNANRIELKGLHYGMPQESLVSESIDNMSIVLSEEHSTLIYPEPATLVKNDLVKEPPAYYQENIFEKEIEVAAVQQAYSDVSDNDVPLAVSRLPLKCASFFAGVGGIDIGFEQASIFNIVYANEFDKFPVVTYEMNSDLKVDCRDIRTVMPEEIPDFDVLLAGFPCQAFSVAGLRKGFDDEKGRGTLFFELMRLIKAKQPQIVFLENVKNLVGHDNGNTFTVILDLLHSQGYHVKHRVLNAMEYGNVPQNRERIYIVGFKNETAYRNFEFPDPVQLKTKLQDIIDFESQIDDKYYYTPGKYKGELYEQLVQAMDDPDTVYQWRRKYVRKNKSGVVPTLTANQGEGGHNVCLVKTATGIRKMTPKECFNAQGFPKDFLLPKMSDSRLYKQAGNSVCVSVISRIAQKIAEALQNAQAQESSSVL